MVRPLGDGIPAANNLPWFWTTPITCPRCGFPFLLTPEDTMPGVVNQIGASAQLTLGWRQLIEGDPTTAQIDTAHLHVDPAQVVGHCPNCGYNPLVKRGPRYSMTKITLNSDPVTTALMDWMALGATAVSFVFSAEWYTVGILLAADHTPISVDSSGEYVACVRRLTDGSLNASTIFCLAAPSQHLTVEEARQHDFALVDSLERFGLTMV
jgi:DNA-directed RNA polymerase subunit RPC12/RpoP